MIGPDSTSALGAAVAGRDDHRLRHISRQRDGTGSHREPFAVPTALPVPEALTASAARNRLDVGVVVPDASGVVTLAPRRPRCWVWRCCSGCASEPAAPHLCRRGSPRCAGGSRSRPARGRRRARTTTTCAGTRPRARVRRRAPRSRPRCDVGARSAAPGRSSRRTAGATADAAAPAVVAFH